MLRVVCLCSCVFCRVSLSSFWVVLELVLAHQSSQWLSCFYPGSLLATLVFFVECLGGVATRALGSLPFYSLLALFPKVRGHQSTQALLPSLFPVLDLLVHVLHFISSPWLSPLFSVIASSLPLLLLFDYDGVLHRSRRGDSKLPFIYQPSVSFQPRSRIFCHLPWTYVIRNHQNSLLDGLSRTLEALG
jgi:hypothetical protein